MLSTIPSGDAETHGGIGLSDLQYSSGRRKMLDLVNGMHSTGVQVDIDLPMIAVIGSQSAGKSSLIESISGITLPRASGTCTRCPTECRLAYSSDPWQCIVSLHFLTDELGRSLGKPRIESFGQIIFHKTEVEERIRRAQRAILNPSTNYHKFLDGEDADPIDRELTFSSNWVSLQISGDDVADLSFCDLPGLIASVGTGGSRGDIELVKGLVTNYIAKPSCIILLTVACETDFENQGAHHLAKTYDPEGKRTVGVLTKPDRIDAGDEEKWLRFIKNEYEALDNGWFSVKQPDTRALAAGISWSEARQQEREYFSSTSPWAALDYEYQNQLGTANLTERLSAVLSDLIAKRLPEIQDELQNLLQTTEDNIRRLPMPPSSDAFGEVLHMLATFSRNLAKYLEGTPQVDGLLQSIRPAQERFQKAIRATAPDFRPYERNSSDSNSFTIPSFLSNEEKSFAPQNDHDAIYIDDVMKRALKAVTRELPNHYPFVVTQEFVGQFVEMWQAPVKNLFDAVNKTLIQHLKKFIQVHFSQYPQLQNKVMTIVTEFVTSISEPALTRIEWLLDLEKRARTLNSHYYTDYREKFLAHYKGSRSQNDNTPLVNKLQSYKPALNHKSQTDFQLIITKILSGLTELGLHSVTPADLPKLLPSDPYDAAIDIMAGVRAYFQVAYKRFADNVPMAIDHELILGLDRDQALEKALRKGLGIGGADAHLRCAEYLKEPGAISKRREELQKKRERLHTAKRQLLELWL
ncbi:Interferon-induced GTP-binding protein Mx [Grifola frondosa]|uniref:Interferon-induced GTP-binding protein Mx n=1 Tax=Grifola frondosa TaxID=5627 RepID=A0A1C7LLZ7_GRIFR|nr:Interferon-induced GTP-binding protein Mx [Grifola frondosa]